MYTFLTADLIITDITYRDIVDFREKVVTKKDRVAIIDAVTTKIITTGIIISFKIRSIGFIIKLAIS
jgi:hypothetical protein